MIGDKTTFKACDIDMLRILMSLLLAFGLKTNK